MNGSASSLLPRLLAALPDAVTAGVFATLWVAPLRFGEWGVGNGMLVMLVEFVMIHAAVLLPMAFILILAHDDARVKAVLLGVGCVVFYLFFVVVLSVGFDTWWPCVAFTWMIASKFSVFVPVRNARRAVGERQLGIWIFSGLAYLVILFATVFIPLPELGFATISSSDIELPRGATGVWVSKPEKIIAFGVFYFAILAWLKWKIMATADPQSEPAGAA